MATATKTRTKHYCKSGSGCKKHAVESPQFPGKFFFCGKHQEELNEIRADFEERAKAKGAGNKKNSTQQTFCEGCGTGRPIYGERFCADCIDE